MPVSCIQPARTIHLNKRQRTGNMSAPVFFEIDQKRSPFPQERQSCGRGDASPETRPRIESSVSRSQAISTAKTCTGPQFPFPKPPLPIEDQLKHLSARRSSGTPSITSITSLSSSFASDESVIRIRQPPAILPRTESTAIENEVLTIRHLARLSIPVPSVLRLLRDRNSRKITAAILERPAGVPLSSVSWPPDDPRRKVVLSSIESTRTLISKCHSSFFGPVASICAGTGCGSWREAFLAMFDALLLDAEDSWVNLPYPTIRDAIARPLKGEEHARDPRLVIPGFAEEHRVLVDQNSGEVTGFVGFRDAFWGDPEAVERVTEKPMYVAYQAVRELAMESVRPSSQSGRIAIEARKRLMGALEALRADG